MLPKAHWTSHSRKSGCRWMTTSFWLSGSLRPLLCSSSVYSCHLFLISSASIRSSWFLSSIAPVFAWNVPLVSPIFLNRSLFFPILLFSSISLYYSLMKAFLSLLVILWNSAFSWVYISLSPLLFASLQIRSVSQSCPTLCDPMNRSMPGLPVHHQLLEFTETHVHLVSEAIQPSHPLSSPSPPAPNLSQHQSLFQWVNSSHEVAKVLEIQL